MSHLYSSYTLMPIKEAVQALIPRLIKLIPPKLHFEHEKSSDVELLAFELLRLWNKQPYQKNWFVFMKLNFFPNLPSYTQIYHRIERLGEVIDAFQQTPQQVGMLLIAYPFVVPNGVLAQKSALLQWVLGHKEKYLDLSAMLGCPRKASSSSTSFYLRMNMTSRQLVS